MDFHEAKDRTLWKLAFCYSGAWGELLYGCDFCIVTGDNIPPIIHESGRREVDCDKCPPIIICSKFLDMKNPKGHGISSEQWKYLFDELFKLPMPEII